MPVPKKTYTLLSELPNVLVGRCVQVLPNRLQCWKGADYLVEEAAPAPAAATQQKAEAPKIEDKKPEAPKSEAAPSLKQQQGAAKGEPGSGTTSEQAQVQQATAPPAAPTGRSYQLCAMHATIMQRADALVEQAELAGQTQPPDEDPKSIHSRLMQKEQIARTTGLKQGESTAQG